jgi:hypothetical protein
VSWQCLDAGQPVVGLGCSLCLLWRLLKKLIWMARVSPIVHLLSVLSTGHRVTRTTCVRVEML